MDQALLSGAEQQDKRQRAENGAHKIPSEYEEDFYCAVPEHWNRLPREGLESPSPKVSRSHLDTILSKRLWGALLGLDQVISSGPFQPEPFWDAVTLSWLED